MRVVIRELFETVILALLIFLALQFSVRTYRVEGLSMRPTLDQGQYVLVNKLVYLRFDPRVMADLVPFFEIDGGRTVFTFHAPRRGEIVIFQFPGDQSRDFVKRVVGVPGDRIEIRQGQLYVNGEGLEEAYITHPDRGDTPEITVPPDAYYVLGDNRRASNDSRDWGPVPGDNLVGRAWVSFWPLDRLHGLWAVPWSLAGASGRTGLP
jgi:signal peptidase I